MQKNVVISIIWIWFMSFEIAIIFHSRISLMLAVVFLFILIVIFKTDHDAMKITEEKKKEEERKMKDRIVEITNISDELKQALKSQMDNITKNMSPETKEKEIINAIVKSTIFSICALPAELWLDPDKKEDYTVTLKLPEQVMHIIAHTYFSLKSSIGGNYTIEDITKQVLNEIFIEGVRTKAIETFGRILDYNVNTSTDLDSLKKRLLKKMREAQDD